MTKMRLVMGLCVVALLAMTAKAVNAADQPPKVLVPGLEQAQVQFSMRYVAYALVQFNANYQLMQQQASVNMTSAQGASKISGENVVKQVAQGDSAADSFNDSAANSTGLQIAAKGTKLDINVYQDDSLPQDLNTVVANHTSGAASDTDVGWRASQLQFRANVPIEDSGQTSADLGDTLRNAADQPAQRTAMATLRPPMKDWVGVNGKFHLSPA